MRIQVSYKFLGGLADGDNLTGSCTLVRIIRGKKEVLFLVDAGLLQCDFRKSIEKNRKILDQLDMSKVDFIILTHSHIDHVGRLPLLVKAGFRGRIICTQPTADLLRVMLEDSAKIQASEAKYLKAKEGKQERKNGHKQKDSSGRKKSKACEIKPLYSLEDVEEALAYVKNGGFEYKKPIKLMTGVSLKFYASGHVLGGAVCVIQIMRPKSTKHFVLGFSGDLGREDGIILPPPDKIPEAINFWMIESTYGGKVHPGREEEIERLLALTTEAVEQKKRVIIPSFSLERTQEIIYLLSYYMQIGRIPPIPIHLDSPMALRISEVYAANWNSPMFKDQDKLRFNPFSIGNPYLNIVGDQVASGELSKSPGPYIVIAGAGMCDAGRVRNHLRENLGSDKTIVCLVGYMAKDSLGRKMQEGLPIVKMNGVEILVKAKIVSFSSFSAHADSTHLVSYTKSALTTDPYAPKKVFIVHGEEASGLALKEKLVGALPTGDWMKNIIIPSVNETVQFNI
jgi:metallo-beta-lactamase family protein